MVIFVLALLPQNSLSKHFTKFQSKRCLLQDLFYYVSVSLVDVYLNQPSTGGKLKDSHCLTDHCSSGLRSTYT